MNSLGGVIARACLCVEYPWWEGSARATLGSRRAPCPPPSSSTFLASLQSSPSLASFNYVDGLGRSGPPPADATVTHQTGRQGQLNLTHLDQPSSWTDADGDG